MYVERSELDIRDGLIYVPQNTVRIQVLSDFVDENHTVLPKPCNTHQWFYYSNNGILSTFWTTANVHEVESTEKEYITINNRQINTKNITTKQKKINIGYGLTEEEMYEIAKTPYIWQQVYNSDGSIPVLLKRYKNNTTTFEGWNGSNLSDRNIELIIEDEKKYKKITTPQIGFFD
jgi:hypothetical protein